MSLFLFHTILWAVLDEMSFFSTFETCSGICLTFPRMSSTVPIALWFLWVFFFMILWAFDFTLILDHWHSLSLIIILVLSFYKVPLVHTSFVSSFFFFLFFICLLNYQGSIDMFVEEASRTPATFKSFARSLRNPCIKCQLGILSMW